MLAAHPRGEERIRKVLAMLVVLSLVMSMFTGVFAPVPKARAAGLPNTITIIKDTVPNGPQDFSFTTTGGLYATIAGNVYETFSLDDDADSTLSNMQVFSDLLPGTYTVTEATAAGYTLANIGTISSDLYATISSDLYARTATIVLEAGGSATATFTNNIIPPTPTPTGTITIIKDTVPNGPQDFSFTTTGGLYATIAGNVYETFSLDDDADSTLSNMQVFSDLLPGTYTVTEAAAAGYTLANIGTISSDLYATISSDLYARTATIVLEAGGSATATFTNNIIPPAPTPTGTITIIKDTVPNGPQDFSFTTTGGLYATIAGNVYETFSLDDDADSTLSNMQVFSDLLPGTYTVTEAAAAGYTLANIGTISSDLYATISSDLYARTATIVLEAGGSATATFTNNIIPPAPTPTGTITIIKDTVPNGPQDFSFTTTGGLYATIAGNVYETFSLD